MSSKKSDTCIFFLTLGKTLPEFYFQAANIYNSVGVTLVPVNFVELQEISKGERDVFLMTHVSCLSEQIKFFKLREKFLDHAIHQSKFRLFHITSFGRVFEYARAQRKGYYHPINLPQLTKEICYQIASKVIEYQEKKESWPGGRRAKLPFSSLA